MTGIPLPDVNQSLNAPFWAAAREHRLIVQQCSACGERQWPPQPICTACLREMGEDDWVEIEQTGTIWSFAIYHRAFHPGFKDKLPYNVAMVKLDAGPMFITNIVGCDAPVIGQRVRAEFCEESKEVTLVRFAPKG